ncbi:uncharacterized protein LOC129938681 isoform X2 [Eupeodes corollae]|uniref:uncharacterized protein LOC129938681 isoform X2 n=1 Tax=Eupeodes corollae TaxID=290404 RepID=UPI00248FF438|nr:uncharacterized protein LOC129938681 isoform X2 [Eupeodes corollae]
MDPICEQKYNFLQKYVPFLANLIKLLANDNEKQGKLAQMQLLYDLLNKPDNSVNIETLEKCEEVLSRVFGQNGGKICEEEFVMPSPLIKAELPEEPEDDVEQVEEQHWQNLNGSVEHRGVDEPFTATSDDCTKEHTEASPEQTNGPEVETSKQEVICKHNSHEDIIHGEEQNGEALEEKSDENEAFKDEKESNLSIEVKNSDSSNLLQSQNEEKTKQMVKDEIENNIEIEEEQNDLDKSKQIGAENGNSKLNVPTDDTKVDEKLENESNPLKASEELELDDSDKDLTTPVTVNDQSNKSEKEVEVNESACTSDNEKHLPAIECEISSPCVEVSQVLDTVQKDEETLKTPEKEALIVPDDKEILKQNSSISNESDSSSPCKQKADPIESNTMCKEALNSTEQADENDAKISHSVKQTPEKETATRHNDDQAVSQNKLDKTDSPEEIQEKSKAPEENQNISVDGDATEKEKATTGDLISQSPTEMLRFKIVSAESLASTETDANPKDNTKDNPKVTDPSETPSSDTAKEVKTTSETNNDPLDPLSHTPEKNKTSEKSSTSPSKHTNKDEDDDDVLLVENRSSPICIDSDPEDEENMKGNRSLPIIPAKPAITPKQKPTLLKPNVRKSTSSVMESIRHIINKNQNSTPKRKIPIQQKPKAMREAGFVKKDPKALMETIDLLDSDSEEERHNNNSKKSKTTKNTDDDVIIVSSTQPQRKLISKKLNHTVPAPKQIPRLYSKLANKSPVKPATAQSNFLNAVNLQPAKSNSANPATFSARLSNKKVIIPNAFYGNPSYNRKSSLSSFSSASSRVSGGVGGGKCEQASSNESAAAPPTRAVGVYSGVSIRHVQDKVLKEWLDGFLTNFASPLQIASHACFVLLQRVLKYRFFQRLKETRIYLNQAAKNCSDESVDVQMLLDLRNVFLENDYLTEAGRRFCRFATNDAFGKPVALTTDSKTGRVTCRTRVASKGDIPTDIAKIPNSAFIRNPKPLTPDKPPASAVHQSPIAATTSVAFNHKTPVNSSKTSPLSNLSTPPSISSKRRGKFRKLSDGLVVAEKDEDDNDYTPKHDEVEPEAEIVTERKRSLRTNRTKRKEAGFTYSEDHDDEEFEAIARKIENKKREELRLAEERELEIEREQLEQQRKINKKTVAKKTTAKRNGGQVVSNCNISTDIPKGPTRKKLRLANTSIVGSEDNDLLTPTWIEADGEDGEVDSLLDFVDDPESPHMDKNPVFEEHSARVDTFEIEDETTEEQASQDSTDIFDTQTNKLLKNIDRNLHLHSKTYDFCVHCERKVPRIVHHYVNEHRSSEVFPSRLRNRDIRRLLTTSNVGFVHLYKGNQIQYAAHCIFCDKEAKFLLPYWFEHFTMHTGEYSFRCSGCHILKPTRSLLTNHITSNTGCPKKGSAIRLVNFDTKVHQIEAHICSICNYVQLHRKNLLRHLRTQHGLDTISPDNIIKVVLLQISAPTNDQDTINNEKSQLALLQNSDDEDQGNINNESLDENSLMMQHDFTDNDDLSFMICGMLDVQTNLSPTG